MANATTKIPILDIILDEGIYPRERIDQKRIGIFAENIRDGFTFEPIEVQPHPEKSGKYRILDGVHRWSAYKATGVAEPEAIIIKNLDGFDPLLYAPLSSERFEAGVVTTMQKKRILGVTSRYVIILKQNME